MMKSRAWQKLSKIMSYEPYLQNHFKLAHLNEQIQDCDQNYNLMWWTGLVDVNGQDIYEGDIVSFETFDAVDVVVFEPPCFRCANHSLQGYSCRVIGNIYQNPELLQSMPM